MKTILNRVTIINAKGDKHKRWFPTEFSSSSLFPASARESSRYIQPAVREFVERLLYSLNVESMCRMYTGSITGGTRRRVNLIIKNINYWIIQVSDFGVVKDAFRWTKGALTKDEHGLLSIKHKYVSTGDSMRFNGCKYTPSGAFFIYLGYRLENVPDYGGKFRTWLVNKFPKLKKKLKYTTHPRFVISLSVHIDTGVAYVFDIATTDVSSDQTINAINKEQEVAYESRQTRGTFRSEGALRISKSH